MPSRGSGPSISTTALAGPYRRIQSAVQDDIPSAVLQHWHAPASEQEAVPNGQAGHEDATHEPPLLDPEPPPLDPPHARHVPDPHAATASASTP